MRQYRPRLNKFQYKLLNNYKTENVVGIISDTHFPFQHRNYLEFVYEIFNQFQVNEVVHIGDLVDGHAWSYHETSTEGYSASKEAEKAQAECNKLFNTFPEAIHIMGNHDSLVSRKAQTHGLPKKFVKTFEEIWEFPKGWKSHFSYEIDNVMYIHGTGKSGQYSAVQFMQDFRQSIVIGHTHSFGGVNYRASYKDLTFALNVGCLIDVDAYAMEYGKNFSRKPTLGCGIVIGGRIAYFIPMNLGTKIQYNEI